MILTCRDCGHVGRYPSQAMADFHFPRHSCALVRERRARAKRRRDRAKASGERRECQHPIAQHEHGTHAAYALDRCRCRPCRDATAAYERDRTRARIYGRTSTTSPAQARAHVLDLMSRGMGAKRIALAAGVAPSTVTELVYGDKKKIRTENAAAILAVRLDLAPGTTVDPSGTVRRLRALVAVGWSISRLAERLGHGRSNVDGLIHERSAPTRGTADAVRALYDDLWDQTPPLGTKYERGARNRSVRYAAKHAWPSPLAWDDDQIDDPDAQPATDAEHRDDLDDVVLLLAMEGRPIKATRAERAEITRRWRAAGRTLAELDRVQGWNVHRDHRSAA